MLRYPEDSEDLKVSISELKGQAGNAGRCMCFYHTNCPTGKE